MYYVTFQPFLPNDHGLKWQQLNLKLDNLMQTQTDLKQTQTKILNKLDHLERRIHLRPEQGDKKNTTRKASKEPAAKTSGKLYIYALSNDVVFTMFTAV